MNRNKADGQCQYLAHVFPFHEHSIEETSGKTQLGAWREPAAAGWPGKGPGEGDEDQKNKHTPHTCKLKGDVIPSAFKCLI